MDKVNDKWLRIGGILVLNLFMNIFFYMDLVHEKQFPFLKIFTLSTVYVIISWEVTRYVVLRVRKNIPGFQNTRKRLFRLTVYVTFATFLITIVKVQFIRITDFYNMAGQPEMKPIIFDYLYTFGMNMFYAMIVTGIYESLYYFSQWSKTFSETELLKKANLQSQFDTLKNQVSPHFLFNSLNTLSSLVEEEKDKEKAINFIAELSRVYRYLLQSNERELTSLSAELDFIKAYFFLLQTRFGEGVKLEVNIPQQYNDFLLPPLTLQILIENAVKHNIVSVHTPLYIRIYIEKNDTLVVDNNLQRKSQQVPGGKMGLVNIMSKYKLLNQPDVIIKETETSFRVKLPLMNNKYPVYPFEKPAVVS